MDNLWGEFDLESIVTPKAILEEQARYLLKMVRNSVYADVELQEMNYDNNELLVPLKRDFNYVFYVKSKFLENYSYNAFSIHHNIEIYPLVMKINDNIKNEIEMELAKRQLMNLSLSPKMPRGYYDIKDEDTFIKVLGLILASKKMKNILSSLVSLAKRN